MSQTEHESYHQVTGNYVTTCLFCRELHRGEPLAKAANISDKAIGLMEAADLLHDAEVISQTRYETIMQTIRHAISDVEEAKELSK
jgi:hypothetical protein